MKATSPASGRNQPVLADEARLALSFASQTPLLPFLLNPQSYPHRPRTVRLVQTHASWVFLAPPFVYKVKKAVNFGFLDFSTLEQRRHLCEREVVLNRRLAPRIYLGVVPIATRNGRLTLGGGDRVVEYAVKMRRLSGRFFLDRLLRRNAVSPADLDRIAAVLKEFYLSQQPTEEIESWGRIDRLRLSTDENFRQTEEFIGHTVSRPAFEVVRDYTDRFYARYRRLFAARIRERRIRDCHGDLHLEHIHLTPRTVNIYDCIEFNDRFRFVDVANDVAFLAMDLDYEGRPDFARHFAHRMAAELNDDGLPRLLDFYKCYRAFVRGKVESLHSLASGAPEAERRAAAARARRYFQLALQYAVAGSEPRLLVVMGRIASGKSTLARALGAELGWEVCSSDPIRKQLAGYPLYERSSAAARRRLYSAQLTEQTYDRLLTLAEARLQRAPGVVLDATFARREQRERLARRFDRRGLNWCVVEARAGDALVQQRLRARDSAPREVSDARREDFARLTRRYQPPDEVPAARRVTVRTVGPLAATVTKALQGLARLRPESRGAPLS